VLFTSRDDCARFSDNPVFASSKVLSEKSLKNEATLALESFMDNLLTRSFKVGEDFLEESMPILQTMACGIGLSSAEGGAASPVLESVLDVLFTRSSKESLPMLHTMACGIGLSFAEGGAAPQKEGLRSIDKRLSTPLSDLSAFLEGHFLSALGGDERRDLRNDGALRCWLDVFLARLLTIGASAVDGASQVALTILEGLFLDRIMLVDLKRLFMRERIVQLLQIKCLSYVFSGVSLVEVDDGSLRNQLVFSGSLEVVIN
jgi:hypothetical protein